MRTAFWFIVAVVTANLNVAHNRHHVLNERNSLETSKDKTETNQQDHKGFAFGSPQNSIITYYTWDSPVLGIPLFMQTTNNETVLRPKDIPTNALYVHINGSQFGNETAWLNGLELLNYTYMPYGIQRNDSIFKLLNYTLESYGYIYDYVQVGLCLVGTHLMFEDTPSSDLMEMSVLDSLLASGDIVTRSFSVTVDTLFDVLFGEIDHGKYEGPLVKFKHYYDESQDDYSNVHPTLLMDGMAGTNFLVYNPVQVQISSYWSLPHEYYYTLFDHFKQNYGMDDDGYMPCLVFNLTEYVSFYFSGEEFQIPVNSFVDFTYDNTLMYPYDAYGKYYTESAACKLDLGQEDGFVGISEALFHNQYLVVDYDNEEIAIARAATESKPQTIEKISTGIPRATPAKYFSVLVSTTTDSDGYEDYSTSYYPSYSMYTGGHFGFNGTETSYTTKSDSSILSKSVASTTGGSTKSDHSTKNSSSSKATGHTQKAGGVMAFVTFFLGALMII